MTEHLVDAYAIYECLYTDMHTHTHLYKPSVCWQTPKSIMWSCLTGKRSSISCSLGKWYSSLLMKPHMNVASGLFLAGDKV